MKILFNPNYIYKRENYKMNFEAKGPKFDPEQLKKLVHNGEGGCSVAQICKTLDITPASYYYWVKKLDIQTPYKASVKHSSSITKERVLELRNSGMKYTDIIAELGVSEDAYNTLLSKWGIVTDYKREKQNIAQITKEQLESLVQGGLSVKAICEELKIPERTYSRLLDKFGLVTGRKAAKQHAASITHEMLQGLVDEGFSKQEICARLKIQEYMFYRLLKRLNVQYNYLHNAHEVKISKAKLEELVKSGKTAKEIASELGIAVTTYHEKAKALGVATVFRESIDRINSVSKEEIQEALDAGMSVSAICEKFCITKMNYTALLRKYNLLTSMRESGEIIAGVTKEQILALRKAGKNTQEICKELNISKSTLRRILSAGKDLEQT